MTTSLRTRIHLSSRPTGFPAPENFADVQVELPALSEAEVRVQNEFIFVDPSPDLSEETNSPRRGANREVRPVGSVKSRRSDSQSLQRALSYPGQDYLYRFPFEMPIGKS